MPKMITGRNNNAAYVMPFSVYVPLPTIIYQACCLNASTAFVFKLLQSSDEMYSLHGEMICSLRSELV